MYAYAEPELSLQLSYDRDRLSDADAARMLGHLAMLLEEIAGNPERSLGSLPMLTPEEQRTQLVAWNDTAALVPPVECVHAQFEAQARRTPDAVAVVAGDQEYTYRELDARANRITRGEQLVRHGGAE